MAEAVPRLPEIVAALRAAYPDRKLTLGGRLVGDLGSVLATRPYPTRRGTTSASAPASSRYRCSGTSGTKATASTSGRLSGSV